MALLESELMRIRVELGYNAMAYSAEPYIGVVAIFDSVIQQYVRAGAKTTSTTPVTASSEPTGQSLVLADPTGFHAGDVVVVDVDTRQERATIQNLSGSSATLLLALPHTGTYPVTVEGGESIVRSILQELVRLGPGGMNGRPGAITKAAARAGIKKVDEIEFFGGGATIGSQGKDSMTTLMELREYWRDELAAVLGVVRLNARGGGGSVSLY